MNGGEFRLFPPGRFCSLHPDPEVDRWTKGPKFSTKQKKRIMLSRSVSKSDILRGIITEKLSTAAREILAVVERTVADYEQEAAGLRQEVQRQRRQLELLQPRLRLHGGDLQSQERGEEPEEPEEPEEQQLSQQTGASVCPGEDKSGRQDFLWYNDDEDEEEQRSAQSTTSLRKTREDLDPDFQIPSRSARSEQKRPRRPSISDTQDHLNLRVRVLEDSQTEVLSNIVFRKSPVQDLKCPLGLAEPDFLDLLRSTFPQLANGEAFDLFLSTRSRRLQRLEVSAVTPEEVHSAMRSSGHSALYIRLKSAGASQSSAEDLHPPQKHDAEQRSSSTSLEQTRVVSRLMSPGDQPEKRRRGRPRLGEEPSHYFLRICMLEDPQSDALSETELRRSSVLDLKCPRGLQEGEFVDLLRSTLPQLAGGDKKFNLYKSDRSKNLVRLKVKTLTPEKIYGSMNATGIRKTLLYIKLKTGENDESEEEHEAERRVSTDGAVMEREASLSSSLELQRGSAPTNTSTLPQDQELQEAGAESNVGDRTLDQDDDWKPDPEELLSKKSKRKRSKRILEEGEKSKEPCKVCGLWYMAYGGLIRHAWSHLDDPPSVCGVCAESFASSEELKEHLQSHQKTNQCSFCGKAFITTTGLSNHMSLHTGNRPYKCHVCDKTFASESALNGHLWVHMENKPLKCDLCPRSFGLKAQLKAHRKWHAGRDKYICNICGRSLYDLRSLTRHRFTHSGERRFSCEVCGKRFKLQGTLRSHKKTHTHRDRSYLCHICCKAFFSNSTLMIHMKTHSGERPFVCSVCGKGFLNSSELKNHTRVHTGEAPYGCSECGRFFKLRSTLKSHILTHSGIKRFTCGLCGKACSRQEHLKIHMRTHNGERPYKCSLCEKDFTQSHCLKTHMKSHQTGESPVVEPSTSEAAPSQV
ncbi:zinc finger and BTB domain-containing protein 11 [Nematolebias whitei]|uniref:zinc finger and BTB domain-containing protein 11 n=1 Tax=Nematolebias whitei TaxID=451745 RepID=UPI001896E110|nr:zinc finger and BTB domain-containing protein 11 [Nematolebias whitei]